MLFCIGEIGGFAGPFIIGTIKDLTGSFLIGACFLASLSVIIFVMGLLLKPSLSLTHKYDDLVKSQNSMAK